MRTRLPQAAAVVAVLFGAWLLLRSPYHAVVNLNAPGVAIAVLGDSIPAGYGCDHPESAWPERMHSALGIPVFNASMVGDTTSGGLKRLDTDVLSHQPRLVIVELGGNDFMNKVGTDVVRRNLETLFTKIHAAGAMAMFVSVPTPTGGDYQQVFQDTANSNGVFFVSNVLQGILGHSDLMSDMIHPNDAGHAKLWSRIEPEVRGLLRAGDAARGR